MARQAFMVGDVLELVDRHRIHVGKVRVEDARARSVRRCAHIVLGPARLFAERFDAPHLQLGLRKDAEILRQLRLHALEIAVGALDVLRRARVIVRQIETLVRAHEDEELFQRALEARRLLSPSPSRRGCARLPKGQARGSRLPSCRSWSAGRAWRRRTRAPFGRARAPCLSGVCALGLSAVMNAATRS